MQAYQIFFAARGLVWAALIIATGVALLMGNDRMALMACLTWLVLRDLARGVDR